MWKVAGKRREMGLGSLRDVPLAKARERAAEARQKLTDGVDPIATRHKPKVMTFAEAADALIDSMASSWRNEKHRAQWKMTLTVYCEPLRSSRWPRWGRRTSEGSPAPLEDQARDRLAPAGPHRAGVRLRPCAGQRSGENPARWRGHLDAILPKRAKLTRGHHKAMPFDEVPAFMAALREREGVAPRALEFAILTAARSGEVLGARWGEVNLEAGVWTVPAARMKAGREHRVPLSAPAVEILRQMEHKRLSEYVFPGMRSGRPLSVMALEMVLRG
jgi:hypothetical protein